MTMFNKFRSVVLGDDGQDNDQGDGGAQGQPEDHVGQVCPQPGAQSPSEASVTWKVVGKTAGRHTAALTQTESSVPEVVRPRQAILSHSSELPTPDTLSLSLSFSLSFSISLSLPPSGLRMQLY